MKSTFDKGWQDWIEININRNCDIVGMYDILLEHDFCPILVKNRLNLTDQDINKSNRTPKKNIENDKEQARLLQQDTEIITAEDRVFLPNAEKIDTDDKLELFKIDNFLNPHECIELVSIIRDNLRESTTTNESGDFKDYRTSKTCDLSLINHRLVNDIDRRICNALGFDSSYSEGIQAQWYDVAEEFKPHTDYFEPNSKEFEEHARVRGQRTWTFMLFLNNTLEGGATKFTRVDRTFSPKRGTALLWNSLTPEGRENIESMHWGMPVEDGFKVIITKWFRLKGKAKKRFTKEPNEYIPAYTDEGFLKARLPEALFNKIYDFYQANEKAAINEHVEGFITSEGNQIPSELIHLTEDLKKEIHQVLLPLVEAWIGHYLKPSYVFGIRRYRNGAVLKEHRDRGKTHVASVILNIEQLVRKPWPLVIQDHNYRQHHLILSPGDMVFYEGAKLTHGRPIAFDGDEYCNVFVHYQLV